MLLLSYLIQTICSVFQFFRRFVLRDEKSQERLQDFLKLSFRKDIIRICFQSLINFLWLLKLSL
jgi:hypothetical protein